MNDMILTIDGIADFEQRVLAQSHHTPVLVDFWADWCGPCLFLAPTLEAVIKEYEGKVLLAKVDTEIDENLKLAGRYKVRGFPTVVLIHKGEEIARFSSNQTKSFIREFIDNNAVLNIILMLAKPDKMLNNRLYQAILKLVHHLTL